MESRIDVLQKNRELDLFVKLIEIRKNNKTKKLKIYKLFKGALKKVKRRARTIANRNKKTKRENLKPE